jgi:hypothetical protein
MAGGGGYGQQPMQAAPMQAVPTGQMGGGAYGGGPGGAPPAGAEYEDYSNEPPLLEGDRLFSCQ